MASIATRKNSGAGICSEASGDTYTPAQGHLTGERIRTWAQYQWCLWTAIAVVVEALVGVRGSCLDDF